MEPLLGQVVLFSGNFAPRGWAFCDGQLLEIASNEALFSILGTTYGGDGHDTFGLPDLRGRVPMHAGAGPNLTPRAIGEKTGSEKVTANATSSSVGVAAPQQTETSGRALLADLSVDTMQPTLCMNYIIALDGMFPRRN